MFDDANAVFPFRALEELAAQQPNAIVDGPFGSNLKVSDYREHGVPVLQGGNLTNDALNLNGLRFVSERKARELARSTVRVGDLVVVKIGTVGLSAIIDDLGRWSRAIIPANLLKATFDSQTTSSSFVHHYLTSVRGRRALIDVASRTAQPALTLGRFRSLSVPQPPLPEQRRIAEILDTVDEAIRKTEEVIAKLEQMKQGLLQDLLTCGIDENGELRDPEQQPEQFKDSLLGRIPRGWEVGPLASWLLERPKNGYSPKQVDEWTGTVMLGLGCLTENGFRPRQLKNAPSDDSRIGSASLTPGDLLLSRSNTRDRVGLAGIYQDVGSPCIYPDLVMRLRPRSDLVTPFLEALLLSPIARTQIEAVAVGTSGSMVKINAKKVLQLKVLIPPKPEQDRIMERLRQIDLAISDEEGEAAKLRLTKCGLMDDLLTARVRVNMNAKDEAAE